MLHAVIMAGGSGTRFWPASRSSRPKQFLALASERSLLRQTFERLAGMVSAANVWVVTNHSTAELTRTELPELPPENVLAEPAGRDTAACVGYAAAVLRRRDPEAVCLVLPADHVIPDVAAFQAALTAGAQHVERAGGLLSFGIRPATPETGYGYLQVGAFEASVAKHQVHQLDRFVEKPDQDTAAAYLASGAYLWNAGIFAWRAADLLDEISRQLPLLAQGLDEIVAALGTAEAERALHRIYPSLPRISVDFGVMEGARRRWVVPVSFSWSDVGSWSALPAVLTADENGNYCRGRVLTFDSRSNLVMAEETAVALVDVHDLIVVATGDAVLVVPRERAQRVKDLVENLEGCGWNDLL